MRAGEGGWVCVGGVGRAVHAHHLINEIKVNCMLVPQSSGESRFEGKAEKKTKKFAAILELKVG